jgi:hypothetical protein
MLAMEKAWRWAMVCKILWERSELAMGLTSARIALRDCSSAGPARKPHNLSAMALRSTDQTTEQSNTSEESYQNVPVWLLEPSFKARNPINEAGTQEIDWDIMMGPPYCCILHLPTGKDISSSHMKRLQGSLHITTWKSRLKARESSWSFPSKIQPHWGWGGGWGGGTLGIISARQSPIHRLTANTLNHKTI